MPTPDWYRPEDVWNEAPQKSLEILGLGPRSRKSKSLTTDHHAAYILSRIRIHTRMLMEMMRRTHARHHTRPVYKDDEEGNPEQVGVEPEVLSDEELLGRYSALRAWHEGHQEVVEHNVSVGGFSIHAASHLPDEEPRRREESSAGAERRHRAEDRGSGNDRW